MFNWSGECESHLYDIDHKLIPTNIHFIILFWVWICIVLNSFKHLHNHPWVPSFEVTKTQNWCTDVRQLKYFISLFHFLAAVYREINPMYVITTDVQGWVILWRKVRPLDIKTYKYHSEKKEIWSAKDGLHRKQDTN